MKLSIIIPSYNRENRISDLLISLFRSVVPWDFEVIVVFDAVSAECLDEIRQHFQLGFCETIVYQDGGIPVPLNVHHSKCLKIISKELRTGQGICRNIGVWSSRGKYILFLDDDVAIPDPESFLINRMRAFENILSSRKVSVGQVLFPPDAVELEKETMTWDVAGIMQSFNGPEIEFYQCLTCNLLGSRETFRENPFNPMFRDYGFEDVELGYRLFKKGYRFYFDTGTHVTHLNRKDRKEWENRFKGLGKNWLLFEAMHPEIILLVETAASPVLFDQKLLYFEHEFKEAEINGAVEFLRSLKIMVMLKSENECLCYNPFRFESGQASIFWYFSRSAPRSISKDLLRRIYLTALWMKLDPRVRLICARDRSGKLYFPEAESSNYLSSIALNQKTGPLRIIFSHSALKVKLRQLKVYFHEYSFFNDRF